MTTELTINDINAVPTLSTEQLRGELTRALSITAQGLAYLAAVWAELQRRGEDLSELRSGLATYLPAIATGELAAEAVVQFAGQRSVLSRIISLPLAEQRRLAGGEPVPVLVPGPDGDLVERQMSVRALTLRQVSQVFDESGRVRSPIEQRQHQAAPRAPGSRRITVAEIRAAIAAMSDDDLRRTAEERGLTLVPRCAQTGCHRAAFAKGLCQNHYRAAKQA